MVVATAVVVAALTGGSALGAEPRVYELRAFSASFPLRDADGNIVRRADVRGSYEAAAVYLADEDANRPTDGTLCVDVYSAREHPLRIATGCASARMRINRDLSEAQVLESATMPLSVLSGSSDAGYATVESVFLRAVGSEAEGSRAAAGAGTIRTHGWSDPTYDFGDTAENEPSQAGSIARRIVIDPGVSAPPVPCPFIYCF